MAKPPSTTELARATAERLRKLARAVEAAPANGALESWLGGVELALTQWEAHLPQPAPAEPATPAETSAAGSSAGNGAGSHTCRIWCDGSCAPNPGPGGWGTIVEIGGERREISGAMAQSTNNIMELTAAIEGLELVPEGTPVHITTDSRYVMDGITKWIKNWKRRGWRKADGDPVLNQEYWVRLDALLQKRPATWEWVRGHTGHPENERCDELANAARLGL